MCTCDPFAFWSRPLPIPCCPCYIYSNSTISTSTFRPKILHTKKHEAVCIPSRGACRSGVCVRHSFGIQRQRHDRPSGHPRHLQGVGHPRDARHLLGRQVAAVNRAWPRAVQGPLRGSRDRVARCLRGGHLLHPRDQHLAHRFPGHHPAPLRGGRTPGADLVGPARRVVDPEAERKVKYFFIRS